jgi:peptide-methionine (R)-S-oxide reductase
MKTIFSLTAVALCLLIMGLFYFRAQGAPKTSAARPPETEAIQSTEADLAPTLPVNKSDAEWKQQLTPEQFAVMRRHSTERPNSSPLVHEHGRGIFRCVACDAPLFASDAKFDSGTGWPSFYRPFIASHVGTSEDRTLFFTRTEVHCARCGAHLGHVFDDGPPPTGLRYCLNGVALKFEPRQ